MRIIMYSDSGLDTHPAPKQYESSQRISSSEGRSDKIAISYFIRLLDEVARMRHILVLWVYV